MLKLLLPKEVKIKITTDDVGLKSKLPTNRTIRCTKKPSLKIFLGFTQSHSGELSDIEGFVQLILGSYKSDQIVNITGIYKIHLKCDCVQGSIVNGIRESILYFFARSSPPGHKIFKEPRIKVFKKLNKPVLSLKIFF